MRYNDFGTWIRTAFPYRVQKISIDAGFTCPNRDGSLSTGGGIYCDNRTFNPAYCERKKTIRQQIEAGKNFFAGKYPEMKYLAYFQAYTNTYDSVENLKRMYEEALGVDDVVGIVIGTRPDCVSTELLNYLEALSRQTFLILEFGIESCNDATLQRINRGHSFACTVEAVEAAALPLHILKIHQMQVIRGTKLADIYEKTPFHVYSCDEYIRLIANYIQYLREDLVLERFVSQAPSQLLIAPNWGLKNYEFTHRLLKYMDEHDIRQGKLAGHL